MADVNSELISIGQQFEGLPMSSLIGGPLLAAAKANGQMALDQARYLLETCFLMELDNDKKPTGNYTPIIVNLTLTRQLISTDADGKPSVQPVSSIIGVPLMTLLPLNTLGVDNVDINFEMEVSSAFSESSKSSDSTETKGESSFDAKANYGLFSVEVKGSVSYDSKSSKEQESHYEKKNSAKYSVAVHAGQIPLPPGVGVIIEAFTANIAPIELKQNAPQKTN